MLTVSNAGLAVMLEAVIRLPLTLALYSNNFQQPTGGGYATKKLDPKRWKVSGAVAIYPDMEFVFTGATTPDVIHGYMVMLGDRVMWHEPLPEPFPVAVRGDACSVIPTLSFRGQSS